MERSTLAFWSLVALLLTGSAFYGFEAWRWQAAAQPRDAQLASGDLVTLKTVLDGDTIVVAKDGDGLATVRLLGVKAFESKAAKDELAVHGRTAEEALRRLAADQPLRVLLNNPPKDRHGRTLASLYAGSDDLGLALVARGQALVYTVYPFAQLQAYLQAQAQARTQHLGLWADPAAVDRADSLIRDWARAAP
jgi:endonuclease YncB( thermonuclease family)